MTQHSIAIGFGLTLLALQIGCGDSSAAGGGGQPAGGGGGGDQGGAGGGELCVVDQSYDPVIDPASFVAEVDNPLYPLVPGTSFTYTEGSDTIVVTVLAETKTVLGVTCVVVHDQATNADGIVEDTMDYYAQDSDGAVWYFGEDTAEYENGEIVSTAGSWEAGVDGAKPGLVIPADPAVGDVYRQEYYACEAEDMGEILDLDVAVTVPFGSFTGCMLTRDTTPLDPAVDENKTYCPGVGLVLAVDIPTGGREELTTVTEP